MDDLASVSLLAVRCGTDASCSRGSSGVTRSMPICNFNSINHLRTNLKCGTGNYFLRDGNLYRRRGNGLPAANCRVDLLLPVQRLTVGWRCNRRTPGGLLVINAYMAMC